MKNLWLSIAILFLMQPNANAFNTIGFHWALNDGDTICWYLDPNVGSSVLTADDWTTRIEAYLALWTAIPNSVLAFEQCGLPGQVTDLDDLAGLETETIIFLVRDGVDSSTGGCVASSGNIGGICNGAVVTIESNEAANTDARVQQVVLHEVGHAIGLGHSDKEAVMGYHFPTSELTSDDFAAAAFLYPKGETEEFAPPGCGSLVLFGNGGGGTGNGPGALGFFALLLFLTACAHRMTSGRVVRPQLILMPAPKE